MATSYFRERARNPYLRQTPIFEDPSVSPTFSRPMPMAPEVIERPPLRADAPAYTAPAFSPLDVLDRERAAYTAKVPTTTGGRIKEALLTAGLGFLQGASRDRENPIAAGLGGAAAGGAISAISPKTGRGYQFETAVRPGIEERLRMQEEQRQRQMTAEDRARAIQMDEAKRRGIEAEASYHSAQAKRALMPAAPHAATPQMKLGRNRTTGVMDYYNALDPESRQQFEPVGPETRMTAPAAEGQLVDLEGPQEQIAQDTLQGRMPSLKQRLSPDEQRYVFGPLGPKDDPQAVAAARTRWDNILKTEMEGIRRYIGEERKAKGELIRQGKPPALKARGTKPVATSQPTANLKDLEKLWK